MVLGIVVTKKPSVIGSTAIYSVVNLELNYEIVLRCFGTMSPHQPRKRSSSVTKMHDRCKIRKGIGNDVN